MQIVAYLKRLMLLKTLEDKMSKFKQYEVSFRTWNVKVAHVIAEDADEAVNVALDETYFDDGEEYEILDIIESELERTDE